MRRMKWLAMWAALALAGAARAGELDQPQFAPGDVWLYDNVEIKNGTRVETQNEVTVERLQGDRMVVSIKAVGSARPPVERLVPLDWSRLRSVNGAETLVNRPLAFPLAVGKSWRVEFSEANPKPGVTREQNAWVFKVIDWEQIKVGGQDYKALKIEANDNWIVETSPRVVNNAIVANGGKGLAAARTESNVIAAKRAAGKAYKAIYYVPSIKRWVKSIEESYDSSGVVNFSTTDELKDFHPGGG